MAAVLNFDIDDGPSRADADDAMKVVLAHLSHLPARLAVPLVNTYRGQLDAIEARSLATVIGKDGDTKAAEAIVAKGGKTSKRARRNAAKRGKAVKTNSELADKMDKGDLSGEQLDVLAGAADKTDGASLTDPDLIDKVAAVDPDKGKIEIDDHVANNATSGKEETRRGKQRRRRRASRSFTDDGCDAIMLAGDRETIDTWWAKINRNADTLFRQDGGRDTPAAQRPRTFNQRLFDAAAGFFANTNTPASSDTASSDTASSDTAKRDTTRGGDGADSGGAESGSAESDHRNPDHRNCARPPVASKRYTPKVTSTRPVIVVTATLDKLSGLDHGQAAHIIGSGPIADSVLAQYLDADPDIVGAIFGVNGQLLWLGRQIRLASQGQILGLIIRDKGCVLCGAHHNKCEAHHIMPWTSPAQGRTDIDQLALVCTDCHNSLHEAEQTLYRSRQTGKWTLRPAQPHELPAKRPPRPTNGQAPLLR